MAHRKRLILLVVAVAVVGAMTAWTVLPGRAANDAARTVAQRYVDYLASGDEDDLEHLWAMSTTETPGALRTAGDLLVAAEERIEVVSVGEPQETPTADVPYPADLEGFVEIDVRYRLDGEEHEWPIVVGKLVGEGGSDVGDWRVVTPMVGSIAWDQPGFADTAMDAYVSSVRQVRRPRLGGSDEDVQPLYPAVYRAQTRFDPYYASDQQRVVVTAGKPVPPPELRIEATKETRDAVRRHVWLRFDSCGDKDDIMGWCPVDDIVQRAGVETLGTRDWWLGLTDKPTITFDGQDITVSGGVFRFRGPQGVQQVEFNGTGDVWLDNQSWRPFLHDLELVEAS